MLRLSKYQLDFLSTVFGLTAAVTGAIAVNGYFPKEMGTIAAVSVAVNGFLQNKPATASPTTEEAEEEQINS